MLKEFRVKNFKSFSDEIVLKFDNVRDYTFNEHLIKNGLINKMILYGKNSSGKSNLGIAIMDIGNHLFDKNYNNHLYPFLNLDTTEDYCSFTYIFKFGDKIVEYSYKKDANLKLLFEEIKENDKIIFQYNFLTNKFINKIKEIETLNLNFDNPDRFSMVKYINNNSILPDNHSIRLIFNFAKNMLWFRSVRNIEFMSTYNGLEEDIPQFIINENLVDELQQFLKDCGIDRKLIVKDILNKKVLLVKFMNGEAPIEQICSTGTMSLIAFFYYMHKVKDISFLIIDEFDAFYHFKLSRSILNSIIKNTNYQAMITTHNPFLVGNDIMRPDCYLQLKDNKIKSFSDSTTKTIRQAHNLQKMMVSNEFEF